MWRLGLCCSSSHNGNWKGTHLCPLTNSNNRNATVTVSDVLFPTIEMLLLLSLKLIYLPGTPILEMLYLMYIWGALQEVRSFHGHADVISDVCFAGKTYVCSASLDNLVSVWNREDGHR